MAGTQMLGAVYPPPLPTPPPATIVASGTWNSGPILAGGARRFGAGATLDKTGTLTVQAFLNAAGTIPAVAAVSATLAAGVANYVSIDGGAPAASYVVIVTNTDATTGNLTAVAVLAGS